MPASGLLAHTLISRFIDHLPYYRQETINARAGVHTPRSTLAAWAGRSGVALEPLYEAHKRANPQAPGAAGSGTAPGAGARRFSAGGVKAARSPGLRAGAAPDAGRAR